MVVTGYRENPPRKPSSETPKISPDKIPATNKDSHEKATTKVMVFRLRVTFMFMFWVIQVLRKAFLRTFDTHTHPCNADNIEHCTFIILISPDLYTPHPTFCCVTI